MSKAIWICGDCRSVNDAGQPRCYRCRVPRATGEMMAETAAMSKAAVAQTATVLTRAARLGAHYRHSWPLAVIAIAAILVATTLDVARAQAGLAMIDKDGRIISPALSDSAVRVAFTWFAVYVASVVAWSLWIAVVVSNVPALVARWPSYGPVSAFLAPFIPFVNLKRPMSVVSEVVVLLGSGEVGAVLLVWTWWAIFLASHFVPVFVLLLPLLPTGSGAPFDNIVLFSQVRVVFLVPSTLLAVVILVTVEHLQRRALRRRATTIVPVG